MFCRNISILTCMWITQNFWKPNSATKMIEFVSHRWVFFISNRSMFYLFLYTKFPQKLRFSCCSRTWNFSGPISSSQVILTGFLTGTILTGTTFIRLTNYHAEWLVRYRQRFLVLPYWSDNHIARIFSQPLSP